MNPKCCLACCATLAPVASPPPNFEIHMLALRDPTHDVWDICCGHDISEIFAAAISKLTGKPVTGSIIERNLRLAYNPASFCDTQMYVRIKTGNRATPPTPCFESHVPRRIDRRRHSRRPIPLSTPSTTNSKPNPLIPQEIKNPKTWRSETIQFGKIELDSKKRAATSRPSHLRARLSPKLGNLAPAVQNREFERRRQLNQDFSQDQAAQVAETKELSRNPRRGVP